MNPLTDNCPECLAPDVDPYSARPDAVRAEYECPRGHRWYTSRLLTAAELHEYEAGAA
jgi:hypothetical protein